MQLQRSQAALRQEWTFSRSRARSSLSSYKLLAHTEHRPGPGGLAAARVVEVILAGGACGLRRLSHSHRFARSRSGVLAAT